MFLGRFLHNLDEKGRLTVPARFRELIEPDGAYIIQGFDRNLIVLPAATFQSMSARIHHMSMTHPDARRLRRLLYSSADRLDVDRAGRILIPQFLRQAADLETGVMIIGSGDYFELWSPEAWEIQDSELQDAEYTANGFADLLLAPE